MTLHHDVVSVFSIQTTVRRGSLVSSSSGSSDDAPPPTETGTPVPDDIRFMSMEEINARLRELDRQPTQHEIDELLAQYEDDSDDTSDLASRNGNGMEDEAEEDEPEREDLILKVLVVGNARCGKTSTIRRYVSKAFSEEYSSTIGADFVEKVIDYDEQLRIHLQLWDIAGQDRFAKLTRAYFREAKGALIVCDITRDNTIDAVVTWKKEIDGCCGDLYDGHVIPVVMIANKSDLLLDPMRALNIGVNMQKCVTSNGILEWFRASAKSGKHIDEAFKCLLDNLVQAHRDEKQAPLPTSEDATNTYTASRDDTIRLSAYRDAPQSTSSDIGICDCN